MYTLPDRIYFTGFMAAGKTTIGRMVANTIGYDFVDLDHQIEREAGKTVQELFDTEGEAAFRVHEQAVLAKQSERKECVIALGGGVLNTDGAWDLLGSSRLVIYLRVPPGALARRIQYGRSVRPLMLGENGEVLPYREIRHKVTEMLQTREHQYEMADIIYEGGTRSVGVTVDRIVDRIRRYRREMGKPYSW